jgi:hypothetical protein
MKSRFTHSPIVLYSLAAALSLTLASAAQASLTLQMNVIHDCYGQVYTFAPNLYLNENGGDSTPITYDQIYSPHTNFTGGVGTGSLNNRDSYPSFSALMQAVTNGTWQLILNVGDPSQHSYTFTVSSTMANNPFVDAVVDYPPDGANNVSPLPTFAWHGPINASFLQVDVYGGNPNIFQYADPGVLSTSTTLPPALPDNSYTFSFYYEANVATSITATTPRDGSGNPPPNWNSLALFDTSSQSGFNVHFVLPISTSATMGHTNIAHYTFDDSGNLHTDSSGNGNDLSDVWWGPVHYFSTDAEAGGGAVQFVGTSDLFAVGDAFPAWTNTFAGSFSASVWINTTTTVGNDGDTLTYYNGQDVIDADTGGPGTIPVGLTGSKVAFLTADTNGNADTLHSQTSVTSGSYVHIVSTRDQSTGQKCIYVNGQLDSSNYATTGILTGETSGNIGGDWGNAGYTGLADDVQIYSGVLQATDVSNLFANPGTTIPDAIGGNNYNSATLGVALNATNFTWAVFGDAPWFAETTNSYDNVSAVQSGSLLDSQSSIMQTTVTGPGTLTFYWQCMANDDSFDLEFDIDGQYVDDIYEDTPWTQDPQVGSEQGTWPIPPGVHVLSWDANTYYDTGSSPDDAGWVDQIVFTPTYSTPSSTTLANATLVGTNFQFSFYSQVYHTNFVQYSTNLAKTNWLPYSTIIGDGTVKTFIAPTNSPAPIFFRIDTQ